MLRITALTPLALAPLVLALAGCGSKSADTTAADSTPPAPSAASTAPEGTDEHAGHMHAMDQAMEMDSGDTAAEQDAEATASSPMEKMMPGLAELSPEDKSSAMKQHICPVSGKMLGTMGTPYKTEVKGQQVWLCCSGCEAKLKENPDEYLAKLNH